MQQLRDATFARDSLQDEVDTLKSTLQCEHEGAANNKRLIGELQSLTEELRKQHEASERQCKAAEMEGAEAVEKASKLLAQLRETDNQCHTAKGECTVLAEQLEKAQRTASMATTLKAEAMKSEATLKAEQGTVAELRAKSAALQAAKDDLQAAKDAMQQQINAGEVRVLQLSSENEKLTEACKQAEAALEAKQHQNEQPITEGKLQQWQEQEAHYKQLIVDLEAERDSWQAVTRNAEDELRSTFHASAGMSAAEPVSQTQTARSALSVILLSIVSVWVLMWLRRQWLLDIHV